MQIVFLARVLHKGVICEPGDMVQVDDATGKHLVARKLAVCRDADEKPQPAVVHAAAAAEPSKKKTKSAASEPADLPQISDEELLK